MQNSQQMVGKNISIVHPLRVPNISVWCLSPRAYWWSLLLWFIELKKDLGKIGLFRNGIGEVINRLELILSNQHERTIALGFLTDMYVIILAIAKIDRGSRQGIKYYFSEIVPFKRRGIPILSQLLEAKPEHLGFRVHNMPISLNIEDIVVSQFELVREGHGGKAWLMSGMVHEKSKFTKAGILKYGCDELILEKESKIINYLCKESLTKGSLTNLRLAQVKKFARNITVNNWENMACLVLIPFGTPVIKEGDGNNIINYIRDVFLTLKLAHSYGVFHRDVSPRNIIVVEELNDDGEKVKRGYLIDWNVAVF